MSESSESWQMVSVSARRGAQATDPGTDLELLPLRVVERHGGGWLLNVAEGCGQDGGVFVNCYSRERGPSWKLREETGEDSEDP